MSSESFVRFWCAITSKKGAKDRAKGVLKAISRYRPKSKRILELGVGIGTVIQFFPNKYKLYGIDVLRKAIKICKKNFPKGKFYVASMHNFKINNKFDVIFSVYDTINFLKNFRQWQSTFDNVNNHLDINGLFIFDMYTEKALRDFKKSTPQIHKFSMGYTWDMPIIRGNNLTWDYRIHERVSKNKYKVHKYKWTEKIFTKAKVKLAIQKRFIILNSYYFDDKRRIFFICRKKN
ncbi:hypothetical protein CMO83_02250 [Candidatus Woesearchaeota archaeon]|nr:hypothetical protein [Candidatus Woesearchaeota archaeon]|tara:strand:+ start:6993 stop:7694 length:702 start_codon:yes stop_codon:yes gene_type:complete